jgi:hypothetical protein
MSTTTPRSPASRTRSTSWVNEPQASSVSAMAVRKPSTPTCLFLGKSLGGYAGRAQWRYIAPCLIFRCTQSTAHPRCCSTRLPLPTFFSHAREHDARAEIDNFLRLDAVVLKRPESVFDKAPDRAVARLAGATAPEPAGACPLPPRRSVQDGPRTVRDWRRRVSPDAAKRARAGEREQRARALRGAASCSVHDPTCVSAGCGDRSSSLGATMTEREAAKRAQPFTGRSNRLPGPPLSVHAGPAKPPSPSLGRALCSAAVSLCPHHPPAKRPTPHSAEVSTRRDELPARPRACRRPRTPRPRASRPRIPSQNAFADAPPSAGAVVSTPLGGDQNPLSRAPSSNPDIPPSRLRSSPHAGLGSVMPSCSPNPGRAPPDGRSSRWFDPARPSRCGRWR